VQADTKMRDSFAGNDRSDSTTPLEEA